MSLNKMSLNKMSLNKMLLNKMLLNKMLLNKMLLNKMSLTNRLDKCHFFCFQMEIAKRLNAIIAQLLPFLSQEVKHHLDQLGRLEVFLETLGLKINHFKTFDGGV